MPKNHFALKLISPLKNLSQILLAPASCELCSQAVKKIPALCPTCLAALKPLPEAHCQICASPFENTDTSAHRCSWCIQKPPAYTQAVAAFEWCEVIATAMHKIKFAAQLSLIKPLAEQSVSSFSPLVHDYAPEMIVPMPLNWRRRLKRGYNQSTLLAESLCRLSQVKIPFVENILRTYCAPQAKKNRQQRLKDLHQVFTLQTPQVFKGKRVLIIDDVMTTGATVQVLSQRIQEAGANEIKVFVLARVRAQK